jgi:hypothetical protein
MNAQKGESETTPSCAPRASCSHAPLRHPARRAPTEVEMNAQSMLGIIHAQELLMVSMIRALPPADRRKVSEEFQGQVELAETPHLSDGHDREMSDAFRAHIRKLSILLASCS